MNWLRSAGLVALLSWSLLSIAGDATTPPDPSRLASDWWTYFVIDPEQEGPDLAERVAAATQRLQELKPEIPMEEQAELVPLVDAIINNLERYRQFVEQAPPVPPPVRPAQDAYTLPEIRELITELRKAGVEHAAALQEIAVMREALKLGERDLSQKKVSYRDLEEAAPERIRMGLALMQAQLRLELGRLELAWRKASAEAGASQLENLQALTATAAQRLTATDEAIEAVVQRREETEKQAEALRVQLLQAQLAQGGTLALTPEEQARARLTAQRLVLLDVEATRLEILASQAGVVERMLRRIEAGNEPDTAADRESLKSHEVRLGDTREKVIEWRRATARNRETSLGQLADVSDPALVAVLEQSAEQADASDRALWDLDEQLIAAQQFGDLLDSLLAEREGSVARGMQVAEEWAGASWSEVMALLETSLFEIGGTPVTALDLIRMVVILTVAFWISRLLRRALERIASKRESVNAGSVYTLGRVMHYIILAVGIMIALSSIGVDFTKFALFASALGVGIGFGLQTLVSNFMAGLIILFEKSLKIGDFVELESGVTGEVREINIRSTLITTNDNIDIVVPNSEFVNGRVTNWTMREVYRRVHVPFGVAYGTDKELVRKAALEAAHDVPVTLTGHLKREPQLWFVEFGDSSLNFELVVWLNPDAVKRPGAVHAAYLWEIDNKLRKYDIEVPFPQRDLHLRSVFGKASSEGWFPPGEDVSNASS